MDMFFSDDWEAIRSIMLYVHTTVTLNVTIKILRNKNAI